MDFSVLSRYDDMLASYFVDGLYLWYDTLRMNGGFVGTTVDKEEVVTRIRKYLLEESYTSKAVKDAVDSFLEIPYFKEYIKDFSPKQLTEFTQHMKRYLFMYKPNAGFEVGSTTRYTGKPEACIIATKDWKAGEQVTCCLGSIAALSAQDDLKLKKEGRDFSVMVSIRKRCACLFLGPARFMNHDCDSNCEFILISQTAITFRVIKDIPKGEEMTVYYADHYFGDDNCECLCSSCERLQQGHFSIQSSEENTVTTPSDSEVATPDENLPNSTRRSGRKRKEISYRDYYVPDNVKRIKPNTCPDVSIKPQPAALHEITNAEMKDDEMASTEMIRADTSRDSISQEEPSMPTNTGLRLDDTQKIQPIDEQPQISSTDEWIYMPAGAYPRPFIQNQAQFDFLNGIQMEQERAHKVKPEDGEHILYVYPPLQPHVYMSNPNQLSTTSSFQISPPIDPDVQQVYDWMDNLSEMSDNEDPEEEKIQFNPENLKCCPQAKEYCMSRISEDPRLCGRCNRHYQIYGLHWPLRKIKKPNGRLKNKQAGKASTPQLTTSPVTVKSNKEMDQTVSSLPAHSQSQQKKQPYQLRNKGANVNGRNRKRNTHQPLISSITKIENAAVAYDSQPVIITSSSLLPSIICNVNVPIYQNELERLRAIDLQQQLEREKAVAALLPTRKTYNVISLDKDIQDSRNRLMHLTIQQHCLLKIRDRLRNELSLQQQMKEEQQNVNRQQEAQQISRQQQEKNKNVKDIANQCVVQSIGTENEQSQAIRPQENLDYMDIISDVEEDNGPIINQKDSTTTIINDTKIAEGAIDSNEETKQETVVNMDLETISIHSSTVDSVSTEIVDVVQDTVVTHEIVEKNIIDDGVTEAEYIQIVEQLNDQEATNCIKMDFENDQNVEKTIVNDEESEAAKSQPEAKVISDQGCVEEDASGEAETMISGAVESLDDLNDKVEITDNDDVDTVEIVKIENEKESKEYAVKTESLKENATIPPEKAKQEAVCDTTGKMSIQSLLAPIQDSRSHRQQYTSKADPIKYTQELHTVQNATRTANINSRRQSPTSVSSSMDEPPVNNTPIVYIEIPVESDKKESKEPTTTSTSAIKSRPITVVPKARNSSSRKASRKGCPIAPPSKEPFPPVTKNKGLYRDPPPPRILPLPTRSISKSNQQGNKQKDSRRCSTTSNIGPFVPNEYSNF